LISNWDMWTNSLISMIFKILWKSILKIDILYLCKHISRKVLKCLWRNHSRIWMMTTTLSVHPKICLSCKLIILLSTHLRLIIMGNAMSKLYSELIWSMRYTLDKCILLQIYWQIWEEYLVLYLLLEVL